MFAACIILSEYQYREYKCTFEHFLLKSFPTEKNDNYISGDDLYRHVMPQADFLYDKQGDIMVDFIGRFETIGADFSLLMEFANRLLSGITAKQAQILYWWILLGFPEHKVIADQLSVSRQNINTHLLRSNADLFKKLLLNFSEQIERLTLHD